jgi:hypothetical protein
MPNGGYRNWASADWISMWPCAACKKPINVCRVCLDGNSSSCSYRRIERVVMVGPMKIIVRFHDRCWARGREMLRDWLERGSPLGQQVSEPPVSEPSRMMG